MIYSDYTHLVIIAYKCDIYIFPTKPIGNRMIYMLVSGIASKPPLMVHAVQMILFDQYASAIMKIISPLSLLFKISNDGTFVSYYNDEN